MSGESNTELRGILAILKREPRNIGAHIKVGVLYSQDKNWAKSASHLKKALVGDKKNPLILEKLSDVLVKSRQPLKAKQYARRLLAVNRDSASANFAMAYVCEALQEMDDALDWIEKSLLLEPDNEEILLSKANILSTIGDMDASLETHLKILKLNPHTSQSWWPVAQLQHFDGENAEQAIAEIDSAIEACDKDGDLRGMLFAAGKIHQDNKNYRQAFEYFEKANVEHDVQIMPDRIIAANINIRETYSQNYLKSQDLGSMESNDQSRRPIFILGQTRSGTTLTESICASHSMVGAGGELPHLSDFNNRLGIYSTQENKHRQEIHALRHSDTKRLAREFVSRTKHLRDGQKRITDKLPHNFLNIGLITLLFPNAQIIHCRRHPMDNCLSIYSNPMRDFHKEYKSKLDVLGEYYQNYVQIMEFWKEACPIPIYDVYYEDLVTNTENVARGMIEHLGLEWEDSVLDRTQSQKVVKTLSVWQVRQPVFQSSKGKWRHYEKQLQPLRDALGTCVEDYENELAGLDGV